LEESLTIGQQSTLLGGGTSGFNGDVITAPATLGIRDHFQTRNQFYGGQVGVQGEFRLGGFFLYGMSKIALGNNNEPIRIEGASTLAVPGAAPQTVNAGLLALASNRGTTSRHPFPHIPAPTLNAGYQSST